MAAVICGAGSWNGIEQFGHCKKEFFAKQLSSFNGIPSQGRRIYILLRIYNTFMLIITIVFCHYYPILFDQKYVQSIIVCCYIP